MKPCYHHVVVPMHKIMLTSRITKHKNEREHTKFNKFGINAYVLGGDRTTSTNQRELQTLGNKSSS